MRDIRRIEPFMELLTEIWKQNPDLRFGQLMNVLESYIEKSDSFNIEENEYLVAMIKFVQERKNPNKELVEDIQEEFEKYEKIKGQTFQRYRYN